ncbi:SDR family NAD(P)-dependent oxidoreductase [Methylibium sp. Root1272]|uniref:SDR family NAD(P)-dependent oxidoreductase n=1 Tax=Methylibium sp. Root1272 TaxID=1736441 RepID=UPI0006F86004|nr:SDR family NAD(P)-dependent oxidoreductase [Methylibium sp. Root1272]KQW69877.1 hypothetical protein ASC67_05160 [Methylibium sp. Root1272]
MHVHRLLDLSGRIAVVTGPGQGLGFEIAEAMAEAGAQVVCADIGRTAAHASRSAHRARGRTRARRCRLTVVRAAASH